MKSFDQREGVIFLNGEFKEWKESKIHFLNHGLHYASFVYEGIRIYNGKPFELKRHLERLEYSAKVLDFELQYSVDELCKICEQLISKNTILNGYLRPAAWRGSEIIATAAPNSSIQLGIACWEVNKSVYINENSSGQKVLISEWIKPLPKSAPVKAKCSALYAVNTLAKHQALKDGADDALLLDPNGSIAELTSSNIFFIKEKQLFTPKTDFILNGITRQIVIDIAKKMQFEVIERDILPSELTMFDESFMTGTACEVTRIESIDNTSFKEHINFDKIAYAYGQLTNAKLIAE